MKETIKLRKSRQRILTISLILLFLMGISALFIGRYEYTWEMMKNVVLNPFGESQLHQIIFKLRVPRVLGAILIGGALSVTGVVYQSIFQNPIASPGTLSAQSGAAFGAALAIFFMWGSVAVTGSAFLMGMLSVVLVYLMSAKLRGNKMLTLILTGSMLSALFSSGTSFLKLVADPNNTLPAITYWLMGSLASLRLVDIIVLSIPVLFGITVFLLNRWRLNVLTMGEEEAQSLGISVKKTRNILLLTATLMTAACVSVSGTIGWVGLVVPHFARRVIGSDHRYLVPCSLIFGSIFLLLVDTIARMLTSIEIPIGILTSFIGAPFFFYLMVKGDKRL